MRRAFVILLTTLLLPSAASAATPWVGLQTVSGQNPAGPFGPMGGFTVKDLDVNASGSAVVAWVDNASHVLAARRTPSGTWSAPQPVSTTNASAVGAVSAAIDAAGDVTVAWANSTTFFSSTAPAGGAFAPARTILGGFTNTPTPSVDVAMNAAGATVVGFASQLVTAPLYGATAPSAGAAWDTPVQLSTPGSGNGGTDPSAAINAAGVAVVAFSDAHYNGSTYSYTVRAAVRPAGGQLGPAATALTYADGYTNPEATVDSSGRVAVLARTTATAPGGLDPTQSSVYAARRDAGAALFTAVSAGDRLAFNCTNGVTDFSGALAVDGDGAVTGAFSCNAKIYTSTRSATGAFPAAPTFLSATSTSPALVLDSAPSGRALLLTGDGGVVRAYRRASAGDSFGSAEPLVDPDQTLTIGGGGIDDAGDAIALVAQSRAMGATTVTDLSSSLLDVTPATASIDGPTTAAPGALVTFSFVGTDPFGGFVGTPSWTSSDGGAATTATFTRTFTSAGTYKIDASQKDVGGFTAAASKTIVVAAPAPTATVTVTPSATPTPVITAQPGGPVPTPTPVAVRCVVPKLKGKTLSAARKALKKAHCKLGKVHKPRHSKKLRVRKQAKKAKTSLPAGSKVSLTLKTKR